MDLETNHLENVCHCCGEPIEEGRFCGRRCAGNFERGVKVYLPSPETIRREALAIRAMSEAEREVITERYGRRCKRRIKR